MYWLYCRRPIRLSCGIPIFSSIFMTSIYNIAMPNNETKIGLWPCLDDKTSVTQFDQYYFYQDTWAAKKVFEIKPACIFDVGSTAILVGILAQRYLTISVDIRPLPVTLPNLECRRGSILDLPFPDNSLELLTVCVLLNI